jgi:Glyoxalase-like domain
MATSVQIVFDCADPARQAAFWAEALHYRIPRPPSGFSSWDDWARAEGIPEESWNDASAIEDPDGAGPRVYFQKVPEGKVGRSARPTSGARSSSAASTGSG